MSAEISTFVLYAERSLHLGRNVCVRGGDIGVRSPAHPNAGVQLTVGSGSRLDREKQVFSPCVSIGDDVGIGQILTNYFRDNDVVLTPLMPFPVLTMPALPVAPAPSSGGGNVTVPHGHTTVLLPGSYGDLTVCGRLELVPGDYSFTCVKAVDCAHIRVTRNLQVLGDQRADEAAEQEKLTSANIRVKTSLVSGREVVIAPADEQPAGELVISVAGSDAPIGPAVSVGERSTIKAVLFAPHGTLALADHVRAAGGFAAFFRRGRPRTASR